jgi:hypothetical protein
MVFFFLSLAPCFAQTPGNNKKKSNKPNLVKTNPLSSMSEEEKRDMEETKRMDKEASYYAPIRYAIVHNWIFDELEVPERRMEVLMDAKQLNEKNLIKIFDLIKKRFPAPMRLVINIHTSLATIETPEEFEMAKDSSDSRFSHTYGKYKTAFYIRFEDGVEGCEFDYGKPPWRKSVDFSNSKQIPKNKPASRN